MVVWQVGICNCESTYVEVVCATKEIAERELFKIRDNLIKDWKQMLKYDKQMYQKMIDNISSDDYENWNNYPQDVPWLNKIKVLDK